MTSIDDCPECGLPIEYRVIIDGQLRCARPWCDTCGVVDEVDPDAWLPLAA